MLPPPAVSTDLDALQSAALLRGDRLPGFTTVDHTRAPFSLFDHAAGRPALVLVGPAEAGVLTGAGELAARRPDARVICVVRADPATLAALAAATAPAPGVLPCADDGSIAAALVGDAPDGAIACDPGLRVVATGPLVEAPRLLDALPAARTVDGAGPRPAVPPLLFVPGVLPVELCADLVRWFGSQRPEPSPMLREVDGESRLVVDPTAKIRHDVGLTDEHLAGVVEACLVRRLLPEIVRLFAYGCRSYEPVKLAAYDAGDNGWFAPHRDNATSDAAHRRFALSCNLDDGHTGGDLRFPEWSPDTFRPAVGEALVFPGNVLHEVTPVTAGRRHALITFLW